MCNEKYPEPVFDETLTKRKPSKVIANDFLPRQVSIVANFRHFVGRSKRYHDDSETRPTKKRKIRGADSPSSMSLVNAETPLADCTESRMAAYAGPLTYLTPVLSDVALHGSLGDTDCEEYACMEAGAQSLHEEMTLVKSVERVAFGDAVVDTWYFSPYPRKVQPVETLFVCEWCLDYFKFKLEFLYHQKHCSAQHPPGNEIFRMDKLSLFEVDGAKCQQYCRNLCFFGKLFLDHKTLQYDTEPFLFYCLTEVSPRGCHLVGYFSKEKVSDMGYNLSCIVTWPHHQRKSFGKILQTMSYTLSLCEGKMGSPEKPLSDLGAAAYDSYWLELLVTLLTNLRLDDGGEPSSDEDSLYNSPSLLDTAVQRLLRRCRQPEADAEGLAVSVDDLSFATAITRSDISSVLYRTNILRNIGGKQVLWLPASEIAKHLQCTGRPCRSVPPARFHFVPWSAAAPRSHEALPPGTTGAKNGSYKV
ncbi:MAG: uncharacterized protein KVP18_004624 [Porospora cf. gigantea A]|nr:MAG: hypothetical protein KVP18_004624 [Porospora cf. gigantea A]